MNKKALEDSSIKAFRAKPSSIEEYISLQETLLASMNQNMLARLDIHELIGGEKNIQMMKDNHANHLRFIASILTTPDSETFVEVLIWVFRAYKSRGFQSNYWPAQINTWISLLKINLSTESYQDIFPVYSWIGTNIPLLEALAEKDEA